MKFKDWLFQEKLKNGFSIEQLANKCNLGTTIVNLYLQGTKVPHYASRWKIHEAFGIDYEKINKMIDEQLREEK